MRSASNLHCIQIESSIAHVHNCNLITSSSWLWIFWCVLFVVVAVVFVSAFYDSNMSAIKLQYFGHWWHALAITLINNTPGWEKNCFDGKNYQSMWTEWAHRTHTVITTSIVGKIIRSRRFSTPFYSNLIMHHSERNARESEAGKRRHAAAKNVDATKMPSVKGARISVMIPHLK